MNSERAIDKAKQHFSKEIIGELKSLDVPEWGDDKGPMTIYYYPKMNFAQQRKIGELLKEGNQAEALCQQLVFRALNENKKPLFAQGEIKELMRDVDPDIILNICNRMAINDQEYSIDEIEKN
jgi:LytS/YehU family sensor histidine kinase